MPLVQYFRARRIWKAQTKADLPEEALRESYAIAAQYEPKFIRAFMKVSRDMVMPAHEAAFLEAWATSSVSEALATLPYFDDNPAEGAIKVYNDKMEAAYLGVIQAAGDDATDELNKYFDVNLKFSALPPPDEAVEIIQKADVSVGVNPYSLKWVKEHGLELSKQMAVSEKKAVNAIIGDAMEQGIRPTDMIKQIKSNIGLTSRQWGAIVKRKALHLDSGMSPDMAETMTAKYREKLLRQRAKLIARTETIRAQSQGRRDAWIVAEESGGLPPVEREWVTQPPSANPDAPCEICIPLNGTKVGLKESYESSVGPIEGPPAHPGCRCTEILGRAEVEGAAETTLPPPVVDEDFSAFDEVQDAGPLFRGTNHLNVIRESAGAHAALADGVYFGSSAAVVQGYGKYVVEYQTTANRLLVVNGDKAMDKIRSQAEKWAKLRMDAHLAEVQAGVTTLDVNLVRELGTPSARVRSYLEHGGYQGLKYKHIVSNDHIDQLVVFRKDRVSEIGEIPSAPKVE